MYNQKANKMNEEISYKEAMEELKQIQQSLQSAPEDLDEMIVKVRRADQLIRYCREKRFSYG